MSKMNPYEMFLKQVDEAAPYLNVEQEFIDILKEPKEVLEITIPLRLEDGTVKIVKGWRSHHNNALGPYKGGVRYHPNVSKDEVMALSAWMSIKCATASLPYGGGKGGVRIAPRELSKAELERAQPGATPLEFPGSWEPMSTSRLPMSTPTRRSCPGSWTPTKKSRDGANPPATPENPLN